jgi:hypothetical protein
MIIDGVEQDFVTWDGKDFAAVQELLHPWRFNGEPLCRLPGADMGRMEVQVGIPGQGTWTAPRVGQLIAVNNGGIVSIH